MKITYIYGIRDLEIDKFIYIGKSNKPRSRYSGLNHSHNDCVRRFVEEKGEDNFQVEQLETVQFEMSEEWVKREKFWVKKFKKEGHPLCNKNDGGGGLTEVTEETRTKISKSKMGKSRSEEVKQRDSKSRLKYYETHDGPMKGKRHTKETRQKQSKSHKKYYETHDQWNKGKFREENPFFGKHHTEEVKQQLSEQKKEWHKTHENPFKGEHHTEAAREQMSLNSGQARSYPAFYNARTDEHIPAGHNLRRTCRELELMYGCMLDLKNGKIEQTNDGWRAVK